MNKVGAQTHEPPRDLGAFLPFEIKTAVIEVCGRAFYYKHLLFDVFRRAGIPDELFIKYEDQPKFVIARQLLDDLEHMGDAGFLLQRRLVTELFKFRRLPDEAVSDSAAGLQALQRLKQLARDHDLDVGERQAQPLQASPESRARVERVAERQRHLAELNKVFAEMCSASDCQARGYDLERLLSELLPLYDINYRRPYRTESEQIDGHFHFRGFDYLVETRWRRDPATLDDLLAFKGKVDRKIESTRGLFISVSGFRPGADEYFRQAGSANLILMDGGDLMVMLDGRVDVPDALQLKADKASQEGKLFFSLTEWLRSGKPMNSAP